MHFFNLTDKVNYDFLTPAAALVIGGRGGRGIKKERFVQDKTKEETFMLSSQHTDAIRASTHPWVSKQVGDCRSSTAGYLITCGQLIFSQPPPLSFADTYFKTI